MIDWPDLPTMKGVMRLINLRHRSRHAEPPALAGGAQEPGERLCADLPYMNAREAETISGMVKTWREMPRQEHEAALRSLRS